MLTEKEVQALYESECAKGCYHYVRRHGKVDDIACAKIAALALVLEISPEDVNTHIEDIIRKLP